MSNPVVVSHGEDFGPVMIDLFAEARTWLPRGWQLVDIVLWGSSTWIDLLGPVTEKHRSVQIHGNGATFAEQWEACRHAMGERFPEKQYPAAIDPPEIDPPDENKEAVHV